VSFRSLPGSAPKFRCTAEPRHPVSAAMSEIARDLFARARRASVNGPAVHRYAVPPHIGIRAADGGLSGVPTGLGDGAARRFSDVWAAKFGQRNWGATVRSLSGFAGECGRRFVGGGHGNAPDTGQLHISDGAH
jgi:hypothetical protein